MSGVISGEDSALLKKGARKSANAKGTFSATAKVGVEQAKAKISLTIQALAGRPLPFPFLPGGHKIGNASRDAAIQVKVP